MSLSLLNIELKATGRRRLETEEERRNSVHPKIKGKELKRKELPLVASLLLLVLASASLLDLEEKDLLPKSDS